MIGVLPIPTAPQGLAGRPHFRATWTQTYCQHNQPLIQPGSSPTACGRDESGWCSDVTSTHGAWRHAWVRFLLPGVSPGTFPHLSTTLSWHHCKQLSTRPAFLGGSFATRHGCNLFRLQFARLQFVHAHPIANDYNIYNMYILCKWPC